MITNDSDDEDEEGATLTGTDRIKSSEIKTLNTPGFAALKTLATPGTFVNNRNHLVHANAENMHLDVNKHRRTPGAPLMRNSAFITPHKIFPGADRDIPSTSAMKSQNKQNQDRKHDQVQIQSQIHTAQKQIRRSGHSDSNASGAMGFGLVCSPVPAEGKPPPGKGKHTGGTKGKVQVVPPTPNFRGVATGRSQNSVGDLGIVGRKTVYTPTDVALAKNSDIFLRRTGTGAYSPYTEQLISGIDGVLKDDDTSTPQSVASFGSQQDTSHTTHRTGTSGDENESWYNSFTEDSGHVQKINR